MGAVSRLGGLLLAPSLLLLAGSAIAAQQPGPKPGSSVTLAPTPTPPPLIASWTSAEMKAVVTGMGLTVTRETRLDNGDPMLVVKGPSGASFVIQGAACTGIGPAMRCQGADIIALVRYETPAKTQAAIERISYPVVNVAVDEGNTVSISRYIIFDEGIHRRNLEANLKVFLAILDEARSLQ
ncbi:MAG: hypothetical protein GC145_09885 [Caulobacter sp.]|nr:hypothetical protein [Caulobacter sp.]